MVCRAWRILADLEGHPFLAVASFLNQEFLTAAGYAFSRPVSTAAPKNGTMNHAAVFSAKFIGTAGD
jgi:hypothetical protein